MAIVLLHELQVSESLITVVFSVPHPSVPTELKMIYEYSWVLVELILTAMPSVTYLCGIRDALVGDDHRRDAHLDPARSLETPGQCDPAMNRSTDSVRSRNRMKRHETHTDSPLSVSHVPMSGMRSVLT